MATGSVRLAADCTRSVWAPRPSANAMSSNCFDFQIGVQHFRSRKTDFQVSAKLLGSFIASSSFGKKKTKPLSCGARRFVIQPNCLPITLGLFEEITWGPKFMSEPLPIRSNTRRRGVFSLGSAGNGASANLNDLSVDEGNTGKDEDAATSSSAASFWPPWNFRLNQTDWNNLIFNWRKDEPLWTVPWTGQTVFQVMVLWFAAFWFIGSWVLPGAAQIAGFSRHSLTFRGQALYSLATDLTEGTIGIWILKRCLSRYLPLPDGWFPLELRGKWIVEACWGCLLFPIVTKLSQLNLYLIPLPTLNASYVDQLPMMSRDLVATFLYVIVISVCAPVWEEVIFRGFLLPSMTRYMPLWGAVVVSALAFALAHFSLQRILPLTFLGLVMGFVFVRSKNLFASIVLHSLWNGFAFLELL